MIQTIVIVRQVPGRNGSSIESKRCFPNPLPDKEDAKREVADFLKRGNFKFLDGNERDIANSQDVARLIDAVRPYLNGASPHVLARERT